MEKVSSDHITRAAIEVAEALSTLRHHGIDVSLPTELLKNFEPITLFDGDDFIFKKLIKKTNVYFEYGCGKSTVYACQHSESKVYAVDTSSLWCNRIKQICEPDTGDRLHIKWVDVGELAEYGHPKSFKHRSNFMTYASWPWLQNQSPDLVLIDGRFRVLCFLMTLKHSRPGTHILFDDYRDRPFYHVVEEFCQLEDMCGRQALFVSSEKAQKRIDDELLLSFQNVVS